MSNKIYTNDIGTVITLDCQVSVSGAVDPTLEVKKPDGTLVSWDATASGETLSTIIEADDLDQIGVYFIQGSFTLGSWIGRSETVELRVYDLFE